MCNFFLSVSFIISVNVRIFTLNMRDIIIYVAWWLEKYLSKRSLIKHTCSWHDKLIVLWKLNRKAKIFLRKTQDVNLSVYNLIIRKNVPKTLKEHKPCKCKCEFESNKCNLNQIWNSIKCWCELKTPGKNVCEKGYIWNSAKNSVVLKIVDMQKALLANHWSCVMKV